MSKGTRGKLSWFSSSHIRTREYTEEVAPTILPAWVGAWACIAV